MCLFVLIEMGELVCVLVASLQLLGGETPHCWDGALVWVEWQGPELPKRMALKPLPSYPLLVAIFFYMWGSLAAAWRFALAPSNLFCFGNEVGQEVQSRSWG